MTLLALNDVRKAFDHRVILRGVSFAIADGERVGLVGPNGSGKTTLMKILAGVEEFDAGERTLRRDLRLGYFEQEPRLDPAARARDVVRAGLVGREAVLAEIDRGHAPRLAGHK